MNLFIKEWPNKTATLMLDNGTVLFTFHSVDDAMVACKDWYQCHVNTGADQANPPGPTNTYLI